MGPSRVRSRVVSGAYSFQQVTWFHGHATRKGGGSTRNRTQQNARGVCDAEVRAAAAAAAAVTAVAECGCSCERGCACGFVVDATAVVECVGVAWAWACVCGEGEGVEEAEGGAGQSPTDVPAAEFIAQHDASDRLAWTKVGLELATNAVDDTLPARQQADAEAPHLGELPGELHVEQAGDLEPLPGCQLARQARVGWRGPTGVQRQPHVDLWPSVGEAVSVGSRVDVIACVDAAAVVECMGVGVWRGRGGGGEGADGAGRD